MIEKQKEQNNWDISKAIAFIHNHKDRDDLKNAENVFLEKINNTESNEQKAEYYYYLLRCELMKHSVFETNKCKELYTSFIKYFKRTEVACINDYKKNKDAISKAQIEALYITMEHYLGSLNKLYHKKNFVDAYTKTYIDEMNFRKDKFKLQKNHIKHLSYSLFGLTSNYGNSMGRWLTTTLVTTFIFAIGFLILDLSASSNLMIDLSKEGTLFDYFYHSVVTFTTLGYGDIAATSALGRVLTVIEVMVGYLMLGALVNLLGKKL